MPYVRCEYRVPADAKLVKPDHTTLQLHQCASRNVRERFTHEKYAASGKQVVVWEGQTHTEKVACCDGCRFKRATPSVSRPTREQVGPGTQLTRLLANIGVSAPPGCGCKALARKMDTWGIEGCRRRHGEIVATIRKHLKAWKWKDALTNTATAAFQALLMGVAWRINPLDPIPGLVQEAIRRAERADGPAQDS